MQGRALRSVTLRQFHRSAQCQEHYLNANEKASTLFLSVS